MKLNVAAFAVTGGIIWGLMVFLIAVANLIWSGYGNVFLGLVASLYPGYHIGAGIGSIIIATLYALIDGVIWGAVFAWIYNLFARRLSGGTS